MTTTERTEKASAEENPLKLSLQEAFFTGRYRGCVRRLDRKQLAVDDSDRCFVEFYVTDI